MIIGSTKHELSRAVLTVSQIQRLRAGNAVKEDLAQVVVPEGVILAADPVLKRGTTNVLLITGDAFGDEAEDFASRFKGQGVLASDDTVKEWIDITA